MIKQYEDYCTMKESNEINRNLITQSEKYSTFVSMSHVIIYMVIVIIFDIWIKQRHDNIHIAWEQ